MAEQAASPAKKAELPGGPLTRRPDLSMATLRFILGLVLLLAVYVYGWHVTKIDLFSERSGLLRPTNLAKMNHILVGLVQPDIVTPVMSPAAADISVVIPVQGGFTEAPTRSPGPGPRLDMGQRVVQPGKQVTVEGTNFPPGAGGTLTWETSLASTPLGPVHADANGNFTAQITIPNEGPGLYFIKADLSAQQKWFGIIPAYGPSATLASSVNLMIETIFLALMGTTISVLISFPLSFLGARNLTRNSPVLQIAYTVVRTLFNILRSIEVMIIAVIWVVVVGIGPFAGVLALGVHGIGALGKLYSEAIEGIDPGPIEAVTATGANRLQTVIYAVVPQIVPQFIAFTMYRWDINVRMATIIGFVGGGGIGFLLIQYINLLQWPQAATAIWLIALVVMIMDYTSAVVRARLV